MLHEVKLERKSFPLRLSIFAIRPGYGAKMATTSPLRPGPDAFHRERSRCVDAFAAAEAVVNGVLDQLKLKRGNETLKQRITNLRKAQPSPGYSNARKATVDATLTDLEACLPLRADIVHGCLQIVEFEHDNRGCFANARQDDHPGLQMRVFTLAELRGVTVLVSEMASRLSA